MRIRTSVTDPLPIGDVPVPGTGGIIGVTYCPGKKDPHVKTGAWRRDLALDVAAIHGWGAEMVLTLLEAHEIDLLEVQRLPQEVEARGMRWLNLPIRDGSIPDEAFEIRWRENEREFHGILKRGGRVLVHCRGGLGRAGMVSARLLVEIWNDARESDSRRATGTRKSDRNAGAGSIRTSVPESRLTLTPASP